MTAFKFLGRPREFQTVEEFVTSMTEYFEDVEMENKQSMEKFGKLTRAPNIAGLCVYMGISKETFYAYAKRTDVNGKLFLDSVKEASTRLENYKLDKAAVGLLREITTIFDLKNNHGYVDKHEVSTPQDNARLTPDDIDKFLKGKIKSNNSKEET